MSGAAPVHGGDIEGIARELGVNSAELLDLSTGVSPFAYPLPPLPAHLLTTMPYTRSSLLEAASAYYGVAVEQLLALAGSQQAIQLLPQLREPAPVLLPATGYEEHRHWWQRAGHRPVFYQHHGREHIAGLIAEWRPRALVLIHPNNPSGERVCREDLLYWRERLGEGGLVVVDEAFIDPLPEQSYADLLPLPGLVMLRSAGKFFGLPGLRLGFALGEPALLAALEEAAGPWSVNALAQWAGELALADVRWQRAARERLLATSAALASVLESALAPQALQMRSTPLFCSLQLPRALAAGLHRALRAQGVLVRHYHPEADIGWLRFGLPAGAAECERLQQALTSGSAGSAALTVRATVRL